MTGSISPDREAVVFLSVSGSAGMTRIVKFVIDTGFTEYLTLPASVIFALNLAPAGTTRGILADGQEVSLNEYRASVLFDNQTRSVVIHESEGDALMGMALLYGSRMTMDIVDGGVVSIDALARASASKV